MPVENRNLEPGTVLVARYKGKDRRCEVVKTDDGLRFRVDDGTEHKSPSSAGRAAMGGVACNGWRFWSVEGTEKPRREPKAKADKPKKEPAAKKAAKTKAAPKKSSTKKGKAMRAAATGESCGCGVCPEAFPSLEEAQAHVASAHAEP